MSPPLLFADEPLLPPGTMEAEEHDLLKAILAVFNEPLTEGYPTTRDSVLAGETIARSFHYIHFAYDGMIYRLADAIPGQNSSAEPLFEECKLVIAPLITHIAQAMGIIRDIVVELRSQLISGNSSWVQVLEPAVQCTLLVKEAKSMWTSSRDKLAHNTIPKIRRLLFHKHNPTPRLATPILEAFGLLTSFPRVYAWTGINQFSTIIDSMDACITSLDVIHDHLTYFGDIIRKVNYDPKKLSEESLDRVSTAQLRYHGSWSQVANYAGSNARLMAAASTRLLNLTEAIQSM